MGEGTIEVLHPLPKGARFRHGVLDFDGTVSLIREGWQQIMIPYFTQELADTPEGRTIPIEQLRREAEEFIAVNTGKQTIYQCIELAEESPGIPRNIRTNIRDACCLPYRSVWTDWRKERFLRRSCWCRALKNFCGC